MWTTTPVSAVTFGALRGQQRGLGLNPGPCFPSPPSESTQLEDPRVQWQREQECMLRDYLSVVRDALSAQKEIYQVKEQRLRLAQEEYQQLNDAWRDKSTSQTSRGSWKQAEQRGRCSRAPSLTRPL